MTWTIFSWRSSPKNMCSVRHSPMPSAPNSRALRASSGVSALARTRSVRSSSAHFRMVSNASPTSGSTSGTSSVVIEPAGAVDGQPIAGVQRGAVDAHLAGRHVDLEVAGAGDRRHAHPARHERRVRGLAALGGHDPLRRVEAGDVVGLGERPREDHVAPVGGRLHRIGRGEDDLSDRGARRRGHARGQDVVLGLRVEGRVQERVERLGVDRLQGLGLVEQPFVHGVDREAHGACAGRLALRVCSM
jgi:hypothetical protein